MRLGLRAPAELPRCYDGFEHVERFWDHTEGVSTARVLPGEFYITSADEMVITTLGSCVSACIRDPRTKVGGLNHFMLPISDGESNDSWLRQDAGVATRYGNFAMERLINEVLKRGARRSELEVKVVGGGQMYASRNQVGLQNITFVRAYLKAEGLTIASEDLGDVHPRQVRYYPRTGRMQVRRLATPMARATTEREEAYRAQLRQEPMTGDIELF